MRIKSCDIRSFGQFKETRFVDLDHPLVVVHGVNEAGKSTFFHFLRSMLYGFYPVHPAEHPYASGEEDSLEGGIAFSSMSSRHIEVRRRLSNDAWGELVNGVASQIGNEPLPALAHVPRPVFESVYTLGLYDMIQFSGDAWERIQERLLGGLSIGHIRPAQDVIRELEEEANRLWLPGGEQSSIIQTLETRERELKRMSVAARENDETLRQLARDSGRLTRELADLEEEQIRLRGERRRVKRLLPILRTTQKIQALREDAGDLSSYLTVPEEPRVILDALEEQLSKERSELEYARRDIEYGREQIQKLSRSILAEALSPEIVKTIRTFKEVELRHRIYACQEAMASMREVQMYAKMLAVRVFVSKSLIPWVGAMLVSMLMVGAGIFMSMPVLWAVGAGLLVFAGLQSYEIVAHNRSVGVDDSESWPDIDEYEEEVAQQKAEVRRLLEGIPLPEIRLENPDLELVSDMEALKGSLADFDAQVRHCNDLEQQFHTRNETTLSRIRAIQEPLKVLGKGDMESGARTLRQRREAARLASQYASSLQQDYPEWEELLTEIESMRAQSGEPNEWTYSDEDMVRIEARLEQIENELRNKATERVEKQKDMERLEQERKVDDIESEIALVLEEQYDVKRQRDRFQLFANLLKQADQQFRIKHQPEVIRQASEYLTRVTDNRYRNMRMDEETGRLVVQETGGPDAIPVGPPLSQGTCDQIYLAIRLAIIDHLDEGKERVPVFLDEVFVNWDRDRRLNAYGILNAMAENRQVFLFTCHDWQMEEAVQHLDAHQVKLERERHRVNGAP